MRVNVNSRGNMSLVIAEIKRVMRDDVARLAFEGHIKAANDVILPAAKKGVPVEYGKLQRSGYVRSNKKKGTVTVGFSAPYGIYVHENTEQKLKGKPRPSGIGKYWGPTGRPKFLTKAHKENRTEVNAIVARTIQNGLRRRRSR